MLNQIKWKISKITPILCTIVFLTLGFVWNLWNPGWMVFFLIPLVSTILYSRSINKVFPIVLGFIYLYIGLVYKVWHPTWIMFLLIPIFDILFPKKKN